MPISARTPLGVGLALTIATSAWASPSVQAPRRAELALLQSLGNATSSERPAARKAYARYLLAHRRAAEALGVLDVMAADQPAAAGTIEHRLMRGEALVGLTRYNEALAALSTDELGTIAHACRLRMIAYAGLAKPAAAVAEWSCTASRSQSFSRHEWRQATLAGISSYASLGQWPSVAGLLNGLPVRSVEARYWRGRLAMAEGRPGEAHRRLTAVVGEADARLKARIAIDLIDIGLASGRIKADAAARRLERLRHSWRGGGIERDILRRLMRLSLEQGDTVQALEWGATLYRYFDLGMGTGAHLEQLRRLLIVQLAPESGLRLPDRAGLFWRFRDLIPLGAGGDDVIRSLADQLAEAGIHDRAADLLTYQLERRLAHGAGGAIGLQAARWRMMQGRPDLALAVLAKTHDKVLDPATMAERALVEAFALLAGGRGAEAYAVLDGYEGRLPTPMLAELYWQARDWGRFVGANTGQLPLPDNGIDPSGRTLVIRHAIATASLGDRRGLSALAARYSPGFSEGPMASAFALLTEPDRPIAPATLAKALGDLADAVPPPHLERWLTAFTLAFANAPKPRDAG